MSLYEKNQASYDGTGRPRNIKIQCKCFDVTFQKKMFTEAVVQRCYVKNMFLKISQNSQENTCA